MKDLIIRKEESKDYREVENLTREAFWNVHTPGCGEHYITHIIRDKECFIKDLDLVAVIDKKIVGNIIYTKSKILGDDNKEHEVITFGPIAVLPQFQGKGIGTNLIEKTKEIAKELGYKAILIYGDPDYYSRCGFKKAEKYKIGTADNMYADALLACELEEGYLSNKAGRFVEDSAFEDISGFEEFDKAFPEKELRDDLPSQKRFLKLVNMRKSRQV